MFTAVFSQWLWKVMNWMERVSRLLSTFLVSQVLWWIHSGRRWRPKLNWHPTPKRDLQSTHRNWSDPRELTAHSLRLRVMKREFRHKTAVLVLNKCAFLAVHLAHSVHIALSTVMSSHVSHPYSDQKSMRRRSRIGLDDGIFGLTSFAVHERNRDGVLSQQFAVFHFAWLWTPFTDSCLKHIDAEVFI